MIPIKNSPFIATLFKTSTAAIIRKNIHRLEVSLKIGNLYGLDHISDGVSQFLVIFLWIIRIIPLTTKLAKINTNLSGSPNSRKNTPFATLQQIRDNQIKKIFICHLFFVYVQTLYINYYKNSSKKQSVSLFKNEIVKILWWLLSRCSYVNRCMENWLFVKLISCEHVSEV